MKRLPSIALLVAMCAGLDAAAALAGAEMAWRPGPQGDLAFETSDFVRTAVFARPGRTFEPADADGAYGPTNRAWNASRRGAWLIADQRYGFDVVAAGLIYNRQDLVERGKQILDWGFARGRPDGSFDCADPFHGTAVFLEAVAHAALLLQTSDLHARNQEWIDHVKPKLRQAAAWMMAPANASAGRAQDEPFTDRFFLNADALGETAMLLHDDRMLKAARGYVRGGLARQDPTGFSPELGGSDTNYHAISLLHAMKYYTLVANEDMRQQLQSKIDWALEWVERRVRPDGTVDRTGDTRAGHAATDSGIEDAQARNQTAAASAAFYWYKITGEERWQRLARRLNQGQHGGPELTPASLR